MAATNGRHSKEQRAFFTSCYQGLYKNYRKSYIEKPIHLISRLPVWNGSASFLYRSICFIIRNIISKCINGTIPQLISWWEFFQATNEANAGIYIKLNTQRKSRGATETIYGTLTQLRDRTLVKTLSKHTAFWDDSSMNKVYIFPRSLHLEGQEMREDSSLVGLLLVYLSQILQNPLSICSCF